MSGRFFEDMKLNTSAVIVAVLGSALITSSAVGADAGSAASGETAAAEGVDNDQITPIITAYKNEREKVRLIILPEKDVKKRMERFRKELPRPTEEIDLIIKLAKDNPKAEGVENGLVWSLRGANPAQLKELNNLFFNHLKKSDSMMSLVRFYVSIKGGESGLREIIAKVDEPKIKLGATYYLAGKLMRDEATKKEGIALMKELAATPDLEKSNPNLLAQAKGDVLAVEKLGIGCTAPDIAGTDHDGKSFKLSDFRGQVVMLHFWGIW